MQANLPLKHKKRTDLWQLRTSVRRVNENLFNAAEPVCKKPHGSYYLAQNAVRQ